MEPVLIDIVGIAHTRAVTVVAHASAEEGIFLEHLPRLFVEVESARSYIHVVSDVYSVDDALDQAFYDVVTDCAKYCDDCNTHGKIDGLRLSVRGFINGKRNAEHERDHSEQYAASRKRHAKAEILEKRHTEERKRFSRSRGEIKSHRRGKQQESRDIVAVAPTYVPIGARPFARLEIGFCDDDAHFHAHGKSYPHNDFCKVFCIVAIFVFFDEVCKEQIHCKHAYAEGNGVWKSGKIIRFCNDAYAAEQERRADCDLRKEHFSEHETLSFFNLDYRISDDKNDDCDSERNESRPQIHEICDLHDRFAVGKKNHQHCAESVDGKRQNVVGKHQNDARHAYERDESERSVLRRPADNDNCKH